MNEQRNWEHREDQGKNSRDSGQDNRRSGPPTGFEGMNFEQRRGSYRGNTSTSTSDQTSDEHASGNRQDDLWGADCF